MKDHLLERMEDMKKTHDDMMEYFEKTIDEFFSFILFPCSSMLFRLKTKLHQEQVKKEEGEDKTIIMRKTLEKTIDDHGVLIFVLTFDSPILRVEKEKRAGSAKNAEGTFRCPFQGGGKDVH